MTDFIEMKAVSWNTAGIRDIDSIKRRERGRELVKCIGILAKTHNIICLQETKLQSAEAPDRRPNFGALDRILPGWEVFMNNLKENSAGGAILVSHDFIRKNSLNITHHIIEKGRIYYVNCQGTNTKPETLAYIIYTSLRKPRARLGA